jgi:hypothetical protein
MSEPDPAAQAAFAPVLVRVDVTDGELRRWRGVLKAAAFAARGAPRVVGTIGNAFLGLAAVLAGLSFFIRPSVHEIALLVLFAVVGVSYLGMESYQPPPPLPLHGTPVAIGAEGIDIASEPKLHLAWRDVARILDAGDAFLVVRRGFRKAPLAIPKRACADGGAELWSRLEVRLAGTRMLHRPRRSDQIVNVAAS